MIKKFNDFINENQQENVLDIEDVYNNLKMPDTVYLNNKKFTGVVFVMNGYNGYTSTFNDGWLYDVKTNEPLRNDEGQVLRAKGRRNARFKFQNGKYKGAI